MRKLRRDISHVPFEELALTTITGRLQFLPSPATWSTGRHN